MMGSRIVTLLRQDLTNSLRDSLLLYVIAAPLLLAALARAFLPSVEGSVPILVLAPSVRGDTAALLDGYFGTETAEDAWAFDERIMRPDAVAGLTSIGGRYILVYEGNEEPAAREAYEAGVASALKEETPVDFRSKSLGGRRSYLYEYAAVILIMLATLLGGMTVGFNIVDDIDTGAVRALAVAPLPLASYMAGRTVFSLFQGLLVGLGTTLILAGASAPYARLILAFIAAAPAAVAVGFFMASIADTQIAAAGAAKLIMPLYLTVPIVSIFVPAAWQWVFFPFPNYWLFLTFRGLFVNTPQALGFLPSAAITFASGIVLDILFVPRLRTRVGLR